MPSTEDLTLKRIQQEISEIVQREKELKSNHTQPVNNNCTNISLNGTSHLNGKAAPFERTQSVPVYLETSKPVTNGRIFAPNPSTKGVMQRFIKSRGRLSLSSISKKSSLPTQSSVWTSPEFLEPAKVYLQQGKPARNGFVPIEERIKKEFEEMQNRELELQSERRKSQPDLMALMNERSPEPIRRPLRAAKSVTHLNDYDSFSDDSSPTSLKPARSLADLCDASEEDIEAPGSLTLIRQWESLIQKNQQAHT